MQRLTWLAAGLSLCLAAPCSAQQNRNWNMRFADMDRNGDGIITRDEWRGNERSFRSHDWNGDGKLSGEEVRPGARRNPNWDEPGPVGTSGYQGQTVDRFRALDTNDDGRVTRDEWRGSAAVFSALDTNRDGVLTRAEAIGNEGAAPDDFRRLDANNDGAITRNEWRWNQAAFDRLDTNRDGRLVRGEFESATDAAPLVNQNQNGAWRAGFERGRIEGIQAGKEDKPRHWDLEGQRELEQADSGYEARMGNRADYQAGYRAGFRGGYREGFGPR